MVYDKVICDWKEVNEGTFKGMSGPYLCSIFLNDLSRKLSVLNMYLTEQLLLLFSRTMTQEMDLLISF